MCGLTGFWQPPGDRADALTERATRMACTLRHRGPDDHGTWVDASAGVALGFRRLAILDLSPLGHQPMASADGRFVIVFNGEIYNFRDLKHELEQVGRTFRSMSDTEVILAGFSEWGIARTIPRLFGMFAIAVWDAAERTLTLARDRLGKKPLYYGRQNGTWLFGSELKALAAHPAFSAELDRQSVADFLRYSYVPSPRSIYAGIHKVAPAHLVVLRNSGAAVPECYWNARVVARDGQRSMLNLGDDDAVAELDTLLRDAVSRRMIADVPLGAFLSGGIDSTAVVALMQAQSSTPVRTFTMGFEIAEYDEAQSAKAVAAHLGTDHTELYVTPRHALDVIPKLAQMYDEPFADSSQIPTFLVSELARRHVTVSLSGDGGDELFGGYTRYFWGTSIWRRTQHVPAAIRRLAATTVREIAPQRWDAAFRLAAPVLPDGWHVRLPGDKMHKLSAVIDAEAPMDVYRRLVSAWHQPEELVIGGGVAAAPPRAAFDDFALSMMLEDLVTYLPDDILVKVDRASMAVSLEVRAPLLDHRVVEWAWRLPRAQRIRGGCSKWLLRRLVHRYVPPALVERPKTGFGVPIDAWLRGPLRDWAEALLDPRRLAEEGALQPGPIAAVWREHVSGHFNHQARLWPVLMFQAWREAWLR